MPCCGIPCIICWDELGCGIDCIIWGDPIWGDAGRPACCICFCIFAAFSIAVCISFAAAFSADACLFRARCLPLDVAALFDPAFFFPSVASPELLFVDPCNHAAALRHALWRDTSETVP